MFKIKWKIELLPTLDVITLKPHTLQEISCIFKYDIL